MRRYAENSDCAAHSTTAALDYPSKLKIRRERTALQVIEKKATSHYLETAQSLDKYQKYQRQRWPCLHDHTKANEDMQADVDPLWIQ